MQEIIFPKDNEEEFINIAEKLNTKEILLAYPYKKNISDYRKKLDFLRTTTKINLDMGLLASPKDIQKSRKICDFVITESTEKDQYVMEKLKPDMVFNFEKDERKDKTHYRMSGLNQVLCRIARENEIIIGFSFSDLLAAEKSQSSTILGRMMQNLRFAEKYRVKTMLASFAKKPYEMRSVKHLETFKRLMMSRK